MKLMKIIIPMIILSTFGENVFADQYVLSMSGSIKKIILVNNKIESIVDILENRKLAHQLWPTYDTKTGYMYFEAEEQDQDGIQRHIYKFNSNQSGSNPERVVAGRRPSLSPNGKLLCYYVHPNELWVLNIATRQKEKIASDLFDFHPALWISNTRIIYENKINKLFIVNVESGEYIDSGYVHIVPSAISPDGEKVLCGSSDARGVYLYKIDNNELVKIKEMKHLSVGSSFVWSKNGANFLFTRQTIREQLMFSEVHDLFIYSLGGKETPILKRITLFGGFAL